MAPSKSSSSVFVALLAVAAMTATVVRTAAVPQTPDDFPPVEENQEVLNSRGLVVAIRQKDWERIRQLLPRVRNLNEALDAGLLTATAAANRNDILFYLLDERNVDPNLRTVGGDQKTALMHAAEGSNLQGIDRLLESGAEAELMDSGNWTALHYAAKNGEPDLVRRLVSFVDSRVATTDGNTPLHYAAQYRHPTAIDVLCLASDPRPNPNAENVLNQTPLRLACCDDAAALAAVLERCGADPNRVDYLNRTPLHYAATAGAVPATELLLKAGANPTIADAMGETPRQLAKRGNHAEVAKILRAAEKRYQAEMATSTTTTAAPPPVEDIRTNEYDDGSEDGAEEAEEGGGEDLRPVVPDEDRRPPPKKDDPDNDRKQAEEIVDVDDGGEEDRRRPPPSQAPPSAGPKRNKKDDNKNMFNWLQYIAPFFFG